MPFHALGTSILLDRLKIISRTTSQVSLADDITDAGKILDLGIWWNMTISEGKKFGYYVNESKSWLIIKNPNHLDHAQNIFKDTGIKITCESATWVLLLLRTLNLNMFVRKLLTGHNK